MMLWPQVATWLPVMKWGNSRGGGNQVATTLVGSAGWQPDRSDGRRFT